MRATIHTIDDIRVQVEDCEACYCASILTSQGMYSLTRNLNGSDHFVSEHGTGWAFPPEIKSALLSAVDQRAKSDLQEMTSQ